jgi:hypothetical protein
MESGQKRFNKELKISFCKLKEFKRFLKKKKKRFFYFLKKIKNFLILILIEKFKPKKERL